MQIPVSPTVPSLFTFRVKDGKMAHLSGVSVQDVSLSFQNEQFKGPILFTHRGLSGPVVLRTSAWLARELFEQDYKFDLKISWLTGKRRTELESEMLAYIESGSRLKVHQLKIEGIPKRLLNFLIEEAGVREYTNWAELGKKGVKSILSQLFEFSVAISGKDTFKDEFVTAGGVELKALNINTFESLAYPGLYFAGEVLDIDGITGGFNFQAAWSVSFMVAKAISDN
jgi:predicted Rossmann fold flavoprotein